MGFSYNALPGEDIDEHCNLGHFLRYLPVTRSSDENDQQ